MEKKKRGRPRKNPIATTQAVAVETIEPDRVMAKVIAQYKNPLWVKASVDGNPVDVLVPKKLAGKFQGKIIPVRKVFKDDQAVYQYAP